MGKKKQSTALGKSIIRDRFGKKERKTGDSFLHTAQLQDGYDWGRLNLQSVTEQNNLDEFLATAELAGTEFTAEKLNIKFVSQDTGSLPHAEELKTLRGLHKENENLLRIPRRPAWSPQMSASEVDQNEKTAFLEWRRSLASVQEDERIVMTPYEKNLDFWRQLWRVIERSDVVVQIVDARHPLLFYCADLEAYVREVDRRKSCLVLINKADYLSEQQREIWADYFTSKGIRIAFWSAIDEATRQELEAKQETVTDNVEDLIIGDGEQFPDMKNENKSNSDFDSNIESSEIDTCETEFKVENNSREMGEMFTDSGENSTQNVTDDGNMVQKSDNAKECMTSDCDTVDDDDCSCDTIDENDSNSEDEVAGSSVSDTNKEHAVKNSSYIHTGPELLELFRGFHNKRNVTDVLTTVGMVGYPNVGKSSTINAILKMKKVPVSATPGRTKHFQTLYVDPSLMLCDCPGLVFPSFVNTQSDLVLAGILPIDQMRDHVSPISLLCQKIPRWVLESTYGICIPKPGEGEDPERPPIAFELLNTYGAMRGFMTNRGLPDGPRSARYLLKDYVNGKLLFCQPPDDVNVEQFNELSLKRTDSRSNKTITEDPAGQSLQKSVPQNPVDAEFFKKDFSQVHTRNARIIQGVDNSSTKAEGSQGSLNQKPWKKHNNRNKKQKLRRVYGHLDN